MSKFKFITTTALLGLLATAPAFAGHRDRPSPFDVRQDRQEARIEQGIQSGALTRKEARVLQRDQERLERLEWRLRRDGSLSRKDRRILQAEYDELSQRIRILKHNDQYRSRDRGWHDAHDWYRRG